MKYPSVDYLSGAVVIKDVMQRGWYTTNPMVGAPYGLEFHDYPVSEGLHFLFYQVAGLLHMPVVLAMNLHYLLGYVLIAIASLYVFLALSLPVAPSIAAAMLFAFMPHHWLPAQSHLMLSSYYMIPMTVLVILWLAEGEQFVQRSPQGSRFRWFTRKGVAAALISALTGSAGIYYAVFGIALLAIMTVYRLVRRPSVIQVLSGMMPIAIITLFLVLNTTPNILYWMRNGFNPVVARRMAVESDIYGLKISQLLLPVVNHRIPALAHLKSTYLTGSNRYISNNDLTATLGVVASFGFLYLLARLLFAKADPTEDGQFFTRLSILTLSATLIATIGGFGSIFAFLVSPQIRVYSRMSIYIAFFSLLGVLALIRRRPRRWHLAAAVIMFAGLWDITPHTLAATPEFLAGIESDRAFVHSIEASVPPGSMIYQLPYFPFPEHGTLNKMQDYDPFRGYIYSDTLRWSYGAMEGRPADDWQKRVASLPIEQMLTTIATAGFKGIYIDSNGYTDGAKDLMSQLGAMLRTTPIRSIDQRFFFYPMTAK